MWDGIIAQALNNASQANGATLGAQVAQPADADGKLALADIDNLLAGMYLQAAGDPDYIIMNPLDNVRLTNLVVGAGQLRYVVQAGDSADQGHLTAQYRVTRYLNKSTGKEMPIILDRYCPQGQWSSCRCRCPSRCRRSRRPSRSRRTRNTGASISPSPIATSSSPTTWMRRVKVYFLGGLGVIARHLSQLLVSTRTALMIATSTSCGSGSRVSRYGTRKARVGAIRQTAYCPIPYPRLYWCVQ